MPNPSTPPPEADSEPEVAPLHPRRRRRLWRWVLLLSPLFLVTGLVLTVVELPKIIPGSYIRDEAVRAITGSLGVPAEIKTLQYDPLSGVVLEGLRIGPPAGFEEDLFVADRLAVQYDLRGALGKTVRIKAVKLDAPTFTLETRDGRTNVDAVLAHLASKAAPSVQDDAPPTVGPLLPIDVLLDELRIGPLGLRMVGQGPQVEVSQVWLTLEGQAGRERLDVRAHLSTDAKAPRGLQVRLPATEQQEALEAEGVLGLDLKIDAKADTRRGLAVEDLQVALQLDPRLDIQVGQRTLPPLSVQARLDTRLRPPEDELEVGRLTMSLNGAPALSASASLRGLRKALEQQMGTLAAMTLSEAVGLTSGADTANLRLDLPLLSVPLTTLNPYVQAFMPDARIEGELGITDLHVRGSPESVQQGLPDEVSAQLSLDGVQAYLPQQMVALSGLDGAIRLLRDPEAEGLRLEGGVQLSRSGLPEVDFRSGEITVEGRVPRLAYPLMGPVKLGLAVALNGVRSGPVTLKRVSLSAGLNGEDLLSEVREGLAEIQVQSELRVEGLVAKTGTSAPYHMPSVDLQVEATLDHLLTPSRSPIVAKAKLRLPELSGPQGLYAKKLVVGLRSTLDDPRRGFPGASKARWTLKAGRLEQGPFVVRRAHFDGKLSFPATAVQGRGPLAGLTLPDKVVTQFELVAGRLRGRGQMRGLDSPLSLTAKVVAQPGKGRLRVPTMHLTLGKSLVLSGQALARRALSARPWASLKLELEHADLGPLLDTVPTIYKAGIEDAAAAGTVKASLLFEGRPSDIDADIDLRSSPVRLVTELELQQVGLRSESAAILLQGLQGSGRLELGPNGFMMANDLAAARLQMGEAEQQRALLQTTVHQQLGFDDGQWRVASTLGVEQVQGATQGGADVSGISAELLLLYALGGDLRLPVLSVRAGSAGFEAQLDGRLARGKYGVLTPELRGHAKVDFDRLRAVWPGTHGLSGRLAAVLDVQPTRESELDVQGSLQMNDFGFTDGVTTLEGAFGRIPLAQTLRLQAPEFDEAVATTVGGLGDDFEARLEELQTRLQGVQGLFSQEDVILVPPRHADHGALRPYRRRHGADLRAERLSFDRYNLESVIAEARWQGGVLRLDHFAAELWDGSLLADMAIQLTPELDLRARMRGTMSNLNLDIPYALATGRKADTSEGGKKYQTSATMDLSFGLKERTINGRVEITKLSQALVQRLFGGLSLSGGGGAVEALGLSERFGVRPVAAKVWISQNLLNVQFDWKRLWIHVYYPSLSPGWLVLDTLLFFLRPALIPTLGGLYVIPTVNGAIRRLSLSDFMEQVFSRYQPEARLQVLAPYVAAQPDD